MSDAAWWKSRWNHLLLAVFVALLSGLVTLRFGFVQDDVFVVVSNPQIRSLESISAIFATPYSRYAGLQGQAYDYRPLPLLTFALEWQVAGPAPWLYHFDNVLLHAAVCLLVALLAHRITGNRLAAAYAGIFFAVMPVHADNVANVTERSSLLAAFFGLAALLGHGAKRRFLRVASAAALFLALLSKESAIVVPALAVLLDVRGADGCASFAPRLLLRRYGPMALAGAAYLALRFLVLGGMGYDPRLHYFAGDPATAVLPTMGRFFFWAYLAPSCLGFHRSSDYSFRSFPTSAPGDLLGWLALAALIGGAVAIAVWFVRRRSVESLGLAWFLLALLPVSNLLVRLIVLGAERLLYLPTVGLALVGGSLAARIVRRTPGRLAVGAYGGWCILQLLAGYEGWRNERAFYDAVLETCPDNVLMLSNRALSAREPDQFPAALADASNAVRVAPWTAEMRYALGWTLLRSGQPTAARFAAEQGLALDASTVFKGRFLLGQCLAAEGRDDEALVEYRRALEIAPALVPALREIAACQFAHGNVAEAGESIRRARAADPADAWSAVLEIRVLLANGRLDEASERATLRPLNRPNGAPSLAARAALALEAKDASAAHALLDQALRADPDASVVHTLLAEVYDREGNPSEAAAERLRARPGGRSLQREALLPAGEQARRRAEALRRVLDLNLALRKLEPVAEEIRAQLSKEEK